MAGKRSTGIRTKLVTPMTNNTRQTTMMKYGLRIENSGIAFPILVEFPRESIAQSSSGLNRLVAINQQVRGWHNKNRQDNRSRKPTNDGACQRRILLATRAEF